MAQQVEPHILKKFEILQKLGKGAYGVVWKAIDKQTKQIVALKKVFDAFQNSTDAQRTFRQVKFLQALNGHENIVTLRNMLKAENNKDIYLVFDFMETDLHAVIRANLLQNIHKKYILYQVLKGLKYMHTGEVIHRDLKPSNILLDSDCSAKLADFGLARSIASANHNQTQPIMTQYVATRWYRAPQILLGSSKYSQAVDMWSIGCILGEMYLGKAVFPGNSTLNQIQRVLQLLGKPSKQQVQSIQSIMAKQCLNQINFVKKRSFTSVFPSMDDEALDLLKKLLIFHPKKRLSIEQALAHPYLKDFHNPSQQTSFNGVITIPINDNTKYSIRQYRQALYRQIANKRIKTQDCSNYFQTVTSNVINIPKKQSMKKDEYKNKEHKMSQYVKDQRQRGKDSQTNNVKKNYSKQNYVVKSSQMSYSKQKPYIQATQKSNFEPNTQYVDKQHRYLDRSYSVYGNNEKRKW